MAHSNYCTTSRDYLLFWGEGGLGLTQVFQFSTYTSRLCRGSIAGLSRVAPTFERQCKDTSFSPFLLHIERNNTPNLLMRPQLVGHI